MANASTITPDELRAMLKEAGLTQCALARTLDVNPRTVRRWMAGTVELNGIAAVAVRSVIRESLFD